jgi:dTDP-4-amino-4,6-dideoxygalactose transaminase
MKLRPHPLGIAIAGVQLGGLDAANGRRRGWVESVEAALAGLESLRPVRAVPGAERAGFHGGLPLLHASGAAARERTACLIEALVAAGLPASPSPYPLLHEQPLFQRGYDVFGRGRGPLGEGFRPYRHGDLPRIEEAHSRLVFLQVPDEPEPGDGKVAGETVRRIVLEQAG